MFELVIISSSQLKLVNKVRLLGSYLHIHFLLISIGYLLDIPYLLYQYY